MSAPDDAHTLRDESSENKWFPDDEILKVPIICECGYKGEAGDLLCSNDEETMWCPQCRTAGWQWK